MTDRPIIFSDLMIRALIEGRKTQTRRIVKPQPDPRLPIAGADMVPGKLGHKMCWLDGRDGSPCGLVEGLRYAPGDRLWVREGVALHYFEHGKHGYRADWSADAAECLPEPRWKPSIHMPRAASRLTLTVTDVRVQRLQDISNTEARAEGAVDEEWDQWREDVMNVAPGGSKIESERDSFSYIWDSLNEKRGYGWDVNPWVVALTFDVHQQNIDHMRDAA